MGDFSRWVLVLASASTACACGGSAENSQIGNQGISRGGASSDGASAGGASGDAGDSVNECTMGPISNAEGRPTTTVCSQSPVVMTSLDGGGSTACAVDADCSSWLHCFRGACSLDACINDSDCATGFACICGSTFYGGNGVHGNVCVPAQCRVDADCGSSGVCSPSYGEYCGGPTGTFCHSAADTCNTSADCCGDTPGCLYQQTIGHWACQSVTVCSG